MVSGVHRKTQARLFAAMNTAAIAAVSTFNSENQTAFDPQQQLEEWHSATIQSGDHWHPIRSRPPESTP